MIWGETGLGTAVIFRNAPDDTDVPQIRGFFIVRWPVDEFSCRTDCQLHVFDRFE